ncbi:MAG: hypothetical protein LBH05_02810 [Deferribacteraceae bacterium]|nr:hypothetical protein [Deferribacteraceae bacterium]
MEMQEEIANKNKQRLHFIEDPETVRDFEVQGVYVSGGEPEAIWVV